MERWKCAYENVYFASSQLYNLNVMNPVLREVVPPSCPCGIYALPISSHFLSFIFIHVFFSFHSNLTIVCSCWALNSSDFGSTIGKRNWGKYVLRSCVGKRKWKHACIMDPLSLTDCHSSTILENICEFIDWWFHLFCGYRILILEQQGRIKGRFIENLSEGNYRRTVWSIHEVAIIISLESKNKMTLVCNAIFSIIYLTF